MKRSSGDKFIKDIKDLFPIKKKQEKAFIEKLSRSIKEFEEEDHIREYDSFVERFGTPKDIVVSYYETIDSDYLLSRMRHKKYAFIVFIITILSILCFSVFKLTYLQQLYDKTQKGIIVCKESTAAESKPKIIEE